MDRKIFQQIFILSIISLNIHAQNGGFKSVSISRNNTKVDGYRGIWFELNQKYEYGDKYSGGLGTYTAKHIPLSVYSPEADKTFFVYGGTTSADERHLLCMIGQYDHKTGMVSKPTVVCDKLGVKDPHDNPSLLIDDDGFIWVFISGRGRHRPGFKFKSSEPLNIDAFDKITEEEMTYPQPWKTDFGFLHLFTKYTGVRQLYFETSADGMSWTDDKILAAIPVHEDEKSGHYQISNCYQGEKVGTFFNRHPNGSVDKRTDLYYVQTTDFGKTWTTVDGVETELPLVKIDSPALAVNYRSVNKNVYLKDMGFDLDGNPVCLYIRSNGHEPGPVSAPYEWCITRWDDHQWQTTVVTQSDHNYDMGSLFISDSTWKIVGPTEVGPQKWGAGGELAVWQSDDTGQHWEKVRNLTQNSLLNHSYVRRPLKYKAPFCFFWADGNSHQFSKSELYFGDFEGNVWKLPYIMNDSSEKPEHLTTHAYLTVQTDKIVLNLFPNPNAGKFNYSVSGKPANWLKVIISDLNGKQLKYEEIKNFPGYYFGEITLPKISGTYHLTAKTNNGSDAERFVIQ